MSTHRAILAVLDASSGLRGLIDAWRRERTSELASAIAIVGHASEQAPARLDQEHGFEAWCATWSDDLAGALADESATAARAAEWSAFARCLAAVRSAAPDPRIGRAVERLLEVSGGSANWFRADQVAHVLGRYPKQSDAPSFADHALALLEMHADAGTAARLDDQAERLLYEAACNEAEMSSRLRVLADTLRTRYPDDRALDETVAAALRDREQSTPRLP